MHDFSKERSGKLLLLNTIKCHWKTVREKTSVKRSVLESMRSVPCFEKNYVGI